MLIDNLSEVGVACTTIGTNAAAEEHICVRKLDDAVAVDRWWSAHACVVYIFFVLIYAQRLNTFLCEQ